MKKYLFILRQAPYHGLHAQEMLDVILTTAAFEQEVALLILDDAIFQLKHSQIAPKKTYKEIGCLFKALKIYDIKTVYVETESLIERGLTRDSLLIPVQTCSRAALSTLMQSYEVVFSA
jgi:tRNA 2-thiouridine synthesizing protein C